MKMSKKLISLLLAVLMVVTLLPTLALADDDDAAAVSETGQVLETVSGFQFPTYTVYCSLLNKLPASHAVITLTDNLTGESTTHTANALGIAFIKTTIFSPLKHVYSVAATCDGPLSGLKYSTLPGIRWTMDGKIDHDKLLLYPILNIGLNYTDHFTYMVGYPDGTFMPQANITRAEVAAIVYRLMTPESRAKFSSADCMFSDVQAGMWFNESVCTLVKAGIISGYPDGTFKPNQSITRAEFSSMIARMFSVSYVGNNSFEDINGHWAQSYMNILSKLGILKGDSNGNANPDANLTRAEAAAMCNRLVGRNSTNSSLNSCKEPITSWPDVSNGAWFYADVLEATNSHDYTWTLNVKNVISGEFVITEQWTKLRTDAPDWK
mgnify:FL=1